MEKQIIIQIDLSNCFCKCEASFYVIFKKKQEFKKEGNISKKKTSVFQKITKGAKH